MYELAKTHGGDVCKLSQLPAMLHKLEPKHVEHIQMPIEKPDPMEAPWPTPWTRSRERARVCTPSRIGWTREFALRLVVFEYVLPRRYAAHVCACARQVAQEARLLPPHEWLTLLAGRPAGAVWVSHIVRAFASETAVGSGIAPRGRIGRGTADEEGTCTCNKIVWDTLSSSVKKFTTRYTNNKHALHSRRRARKSVRGPPLETTPITTPGSYEVGSGTYSYDSGSGSLSFECFSARFGLQTACGIPDSEPTETRGENGRLCASWRECTDYRDKATKACESLGDANPVADLTRIGRGSVQHPLAHPSPARRRPQCIHHPRPCACCRSSSPCPSRARRACSRRSWWASPRARREA